MGYSLDDRGVGVRFRVVVRNLSLLLKVNKVHGAYSASNPMGTGGNYRRDKAAGA
jgi:hypothetical protein